MEKSNLRVAKLIKLATDDGMVECHDNVKIGTEYIVDISTKRIITYFNNKYQIKHMKETIQTVENGAHYASLPTEMLEIEKGD